MVKTSILYKGEKHCELIHEPSKSQIETDAPKDNQGKGEKFSPTDLVAAALGSCVLTVMAIVAEREGIIFRGASAEVEKEMSANPRRIGSLRVKIKMPSGIPAKERPRLESTAHHCPVHQSLHPDIESPIEFSYPD